MSDQGKEAVEAVKKMAIQVLKMAEAIAMTTATVEEAKFRPGALLVHRRIQKMIENATKDETKLEQNEGKDEEGDSGAD